MGLTLRLTTLAGIGTGSWGLRAALLVISSINIISINWSNVSPLFIFDILLFASLLFLSPGVTLAGSILLLVRPMSLEQRGVIGFITFISAILTVIITSLFVALSMS